jgi:hypothetical protein
MFTGLALLLLGVMSVRNTFSLESLRELMHDRHWSLSNRISRLEPQEDYDDEEETQEDDVVQGTTVGDSGAGETGAIDGK